MKLFKMLFTGNPKKHNNNSDKVRLSDTQRNINNTPIMDVIPQKIMDIFKLNDYGHTAKIFIQTVIFYLMRISTPELISHDNNRTIYNCIKEYNNTYESFDDLVKKLFTCIKQNNSTISDDIINKEIINALRYAYKELIRSSKGGYKRKAKTQRRQRKQRK